MTISIIGAGMAGLLAGAMFRQEAQIYEAAASLPNNHHALLRFRSDEIAQHLNIEFSQVDVMKIVKPWRNKIAEAVGYSLKCNGKASLRSIRSAEGKVDKRFIAPPDFIHQLEELQTNEIRFDAKIGRAWIDQYDNNAGPIISTMPMGSLMSLLEYPEPLEFSYRHGHVIKAELELPSDLCATVYYPDPNTPMIRATLTSDLLQVELVEEYDRNKFSLEYIMALVLQDFGLEECKYSAELVQQKYAKITAIDDRARRKFIMWATDNFNIYSLGRFAVWKPGLLLDDVFHDVRKIQAMMRNGTNYHARVN